MNHLSVHQQYMKRCLHLAQLAEGNTSPNPMVGSVIVHKNKIIGEGYHLQAGQPHAEVNAIQNVQDPSLLSHSTLYVNLEPCAHYGKTPPCSLLIIEKKIPRVVIGCVDSYSEVAGKGIEMMQKAGIEVIVNILEQESRELNRRFFTFHEKKRPYIILKWAQTLDGFIDIDRSQTDYGQPTWITNEWARRAVHQQRSTEGAILVGTNTIIKDNPSLTLRDWTGKQPLRLVIDKDCIIPAQAHVLDGQHNTVVYNTQINSTLNKVEHHCLENQETLNEQILIDLHRRGIQSLIVEGGRSTLASFIDQNIWDEAHVYIGDQWFFKGTKAPELQGFLKSRDEFGTSKRFVYRNKL